MTMLSLCMWNGSIGRSLTCGFYIFYTPLERLNLELSVGGEATIQIRCVVCLCVCFSGNNEILCSAHNGFRERDSTLVVCYGQKIKAPRKECPQSAGHTPWWLNLSLPSDSRWGEGPGRAQTSCGAWERMEQTFPSHRDVVTSCYHLKTVVPKVSVTSRPPAKQDSGVLRFLLMRIFPFLPQCRSRTVGGHASCPCRSLHAEKTRGLLPLSGPAHGLYMVFLVRCPSS